MSVAFAKSLLKSISPIFFKKLMFKLGNYLGNDVFGYNFNNTESTLVRLSTKGFHPEYVIDIGAYTGEWTLMTRQIFPTSKILMIEPQISCRERLSNIVNESNNNTYYSNSLLGAIDNRTVDFNESANASSIYEMNSDVTSYKQSKVLVTLDTVLLSYPAFIKSKLIKLDVQGYEIEILKGSSSVLKNTEFILMEVSLIDIYKNSPLIYDVFLFMQKSGYYVYDFCSQIRLPDFTLWQVDILFIHEQSKYKPDNFLIGNTIIN